MNRRDAIKTCTAAIVSVMGGLPLVRRMFARKQTGDANFPAQFSESVSIGAVGPAGPYADMTVMTYHREFTDEERAELVAKFQQQVDSGKIMFVPLPRWKIVEAEIET